MKQRVRDLLPLPVASLLRKVKRSIIRQTRRLVEFIGYNVARTDDYYSPLPTESHLLKNIERWNRPSSLAGVQFDLSENKSFLSGLLDSYQDEFLQLPGYEENLKTGFGLGYTEIDALVLYAMMRHLQPRRYLEVGSGISTYYTSLAAKANAIDGRLMQITCIEPHPFPKLYSIPHIHVIADEVQNVDISEFASLEAGDVLFIDSSHVLRIDGDVPFLFLEVLPILKPGVIIHIHDVPFPYNIPYPVEQWVTGKVEGAPYWPVFWNEAMLLQAFLAFNTHFKIMLSTSMIRYHDESFLQERIPLYKTIKDEPNTFSAIWLKKVL